jgi:hypothetical protein
MVDARALREQVREKYREVALDPSRTFHFHTGRGLAARCGYEAAPVGALPDRAVESFSGVGNPFSLRRLRPGERVVDVGRADICSSPISPTAGPSRPGPCATSTCGPVE